VTTNAFDARRGTVRLGVLLVDATDWQMKEPSLIETTSFAQDLPSALSYAANLKEGDHAVLFYDNLVVAAECLSAYIEAAMIKDQITYFVGLPRQQYTTLFEQVGIKVDELENCGYLKHSSIEEFCKKFGLAEDRLLQNMEEPLIHESEPKRPHLIVMGRQFPENMTSEGVVDFEEALGKLCEYPVRATIICCYPARNTFEATTDGAEPPLFGQLLKCHGHCILQGIAMRTSNFAGNL